MRINDGSVVTEWKLRKLRRIPKSPYRCAKALLFRLSISYGLCARFIISRVSFFFFIIFNISDMFFFFNILFTLYYYDYHFYYMYYSLRLKCIFCLLTRWCRISSIFYISSNFHRRFMRLNLYEKLIHPHSYIMIVINGDFWQIVMPVLPSYVFNHFIPQSPKSNDLDRVRYSRIGGRLDMHWEAH